MSLRRLGWTCLVLAACSGETPKPAADTAAATPGELVLPDSLVLRAPGGAEVWFTDARAARDSAGRPCVERVMEIRTAERTIPVPLLYTGAAPVLVGDTAFRADIWLDCRPGNRYVVSLRTGFPVHVR